MSTVALVFKQSGDTGKTKTWSVSGPDGGPLGQVSWYAQWRRYVFYPMSATLYDADCLTQITGFIEARMRERKKA